MRNFAVIGAGLLSIVGFVGAASAADLAAQTYTKAPAIVDPSYNWTGFYVGIEGGGVWGQSRHYYDDLNFPPLVGLALTGGIKADGALLGGTFGYNYQLGNNVVLGFEDDLSWTNNKGAANIIAPFVPFTNTGETSQSWLYTVRGRLGFAWNRWMVFGTGGAAFTDESIRLCSLAVGCAGQSKIASGWTAGGGVEYAFAGNWSAKLEYLHVDFGSQYFAPTPDSAGSAFRPRTVSLTDDIVRAGVNYKFGWGGPVVARY